jgi:hypothetical protein
MCSFLEEVEGLIIEALDDSLRLGPAHDTLLRSTLAQSEQVSTSLTATACLITALYNDEDDMHHHASRSVENGASDTDRDTDRDREPLPVACVQFLASGRALAVVEGHVNHTGVCSHRPQMHLFGLSAASSLTSSASSTSSSTTSASAAAAASAQGTETAPALSRPFLTLDLPACGACLCCDDRMGDNRLICGTVAGDILSLPTALFLLQGTQSPSWQWRQASVHAGGVTCLTPYLPLPAALLSCGNDGRVALWHVRTGRCIASLQLSQLSKASHLPSVGAGSLLEPAITTTGTVVMGGGCTAMAALQDSLFFVVGTEGGTLTKCRLSGLTQDAQLSSSASATLTVLDGGSLGRKTPVRAIQAAPMSHSAYAVVMGNGLLFFANSAAIRPSLRLPASSNAPLASLAWSSTNPCAFLVAQDNGTLTYYDLSATGSSSSSSENATATATATAAAAQDTSNQTLSLHEYPLCGWSYPVEGGKTLRVVGAGTSSSLTVANGAGRGLVAVVHRMGAHALVASPAHSMREGVLILRLSVQELDRHSTSQGASVGAFDVLNALLVNRGIQDAVDSESEDEGEHNLSLHEGRADSHAMSLSPVAHQPLVRNSVIDSQAPADEDGGSSDSEDLW